MSAIRTPDQRLRVFVSSTIEELREERRVVREAIERLRLIPVLFESGARPHPPRELYRAYLDQSDIFIGIYASSYGWVAPDMRISGLEDEYHLSTGRPQLIYIKQGGGVREPKLEELLRTIKGSEGVSYQKFETPEQLADLLQNDLAVLLSERFAGKEKSERPQGHGLPAMRNATIGRDRERAELAELLLRKDIGLVTLTGTGVPARAIWLCVWRMMWPRAFRMAHAMSRSPAWGGRNRCCPRSRRRCAWWIPGRVI
ncbi:MAG: DUF4062 domain-containing protein [Flavobacteriales bacterium]|nr:DUF4062 domain-containing protein [Flavobacteriales bacterium]